MSTRTLTVWQAQYDQNLLKKSGYNFQIAKSVARSSGGQPSYNVVWKSKSIAPITNISWDVEYALNWRADVPAAGASVDVGGFWQRCEKGEVYDLNSDGYWAKSSEAKVPGFLKVGKVNYKYGDTPGIHIVVGIRNASNDYDPIYVDQTELYPNSTAMYQPQETVQFWYEAGSKSSTMVSEAKVQTGTIDFTSPAPTTMKYAWYTTFLLESGTWNHSQTKPMPSLCAPPPSQSETDGFTSSASGLPVLAPSFEIDYFPVTAMVSLAITVVSAYQYQLVDKIRGFLSNTNTEVTVKMDFENGKQLNISYGKPKEAANNSLASFGVPVYEALTPIEKALQSALFEGLLPAGESWTIAPVN